VSSSLDDLDRVLEQTDDADDVLRRVVALLAEQDGISWAGIAFLEDGALTIGPAAGGADTAPRTSTPISFQGDPVGELLVEGTLDAAVLADVAARIAPYVLIGWDTGGEAWEP
jgi:putative methionine-R-sulfoxide reductase with GAF domain